MILHHSTLRCWKNTKTRLEAVQKHVWKPHKNTSGSRTKTRLEAVQKHVWKPYKNVERPFDFIIYYFLAGFQAWTGLRQPTILWTYDLDGTDGSLLDQYVPMPLRASLCFYMVCAVVVVVRSSRRHLAWTIFVQNTNPVS